MCSPCVTTEDALTERLFQSTIHTLELFSVYLGKRLDLYSALSRQPMTPPELSAAAGIDRRYAREWLEQQAVAGFLKLEANNADPDSRIYRMPADHTGVLVDADSATHVAPFAQMIAGIGAALPEVAEAYRSGAGVPYTRYGSDFREGQGGINRPAFSRDLTGSWLPSIADLHSRLRDTSGCRIADVGCGHGWSAIALSEAYPEAEVIGFDVDAASVEEARERATTAGSTANFVHIDADELADHGRFDLVLLLEVLHDMSRPHEALAEIRKALAPGGSVVIADERVAEEFHANGDLLERMMYGWSVSHCLPVSMAEAPSRALGTALRPATVQSLANEAGYAEFEVLPIENELFRFYRLR